MRSNDGIYYEFGGDLKMTLFVEWESSPSPATERSYLNMRMYLKYGGSANFAGVNESSLDIKAWVTNTTIPESQATIQNSYMPEFEPTPYPGMGRLPRYSHIKIFDTMQRQYVVVYPLDPTTGKVSEDCTIDVRVRLQGDVKQYMDTPAQYVICDRTFSIDLPHLELDAPKIDLSVSERTKNSVRLSYTSSQPLKQPTEWIVGSMRGEFEGDTVVVTGLTPYTTYSAQIAGVSAINDKQGLSDVYAFRTSPIYSTGLHVDDVIVYRGETANLSVTIYPSSASIKAYNYTIADTSIATVSNGKVIPLKNGATTITVRTTDGTNYSATATITVKTHATGITARDLTLSIGDTAKLSYTVYPLDTTDKRVTFESSDPTIASVVNGEVTALSDGLAIITVRTMDGGYTAPARVTVGSDYTWYDYESTPERMTVDEYNHIRVDVGTLRAMLIDKGFDVAQLPGGGVTYDVPYKEVVDKLQNMEYNMDVLSDTPCRSIYYVAPKLVERTSDYDDVERWIRILNEMREILKGYKPMWDCIRCTDGYPTIDGFHLVVEGEWISPYKYVLCTDGYPTIDGQKIMIDTGE